MKTIVNTCGAHARAMAWMVTLVLTISASAQFGVRPVDPVVYLADFQAYVQMENGGLRLVRVRAASPAQKLGLQEKDLIQTINGRPITSVQQFRQAIFHSSEPVSFISGTRGAGGQPFVARLAVDQNQIQVNQGLQLVPQPGMAGFNPNVAVGAVLPFPELGVNVRVEQQGMRLFTIDGGSVAAQLQLSTDDLLQTLNGRAIHTPDDFRREFAQNPNRIAYLGGNRGPRGAQPFVATLLKKPGGGVAFHEPLQWYNPNGFQPPETVPPVIPPAVPPRPDGPVPPPPPRPTEQMIPTPGNGAFSPTLGAHIAFEGGGARIVRIERGALASQLGFYPNDVVQSINSQPVRNFEELRAALAGGQFAVYYVAGYRRGRGGPSQPFTATVRREGDQFIADRGTQLWPGGPAPVAVDRNIELPELEAVFTVRQQGMLLSKLDRNGLARKLGLEEGDLIQQINGRPVYSRDDFLAVIYSSPEPFIFISGIRAHRNNQPFIATLYREPDKLRVHARLRVQ